MNALEADLVALTGDLFDFDPRHVEAGARRLGALRARLGVYTVLGNHDGYTGIELVAEALGRLAPDMVLLRRDVVRLATGAPLYLAGIDDPGTRFSARDLHLPELEELAVRAPEDGPVILLVHRPEAFPQAARLGFPLVLAGHTHGGQLALPTRGRPPQPGFPRHPLPPRPLRGERERPLREPRHRRRGARDPHQLRAGDRDHRAGVDSAHGTAAARLAEADRPAPARRVLRVRRHRATSRTPISSRRSCPPWLPAPLLLVYVSGVCEVLGGLGALLPQTRSLAGWGLVALLIAVFPANVHMAVESERWVAEGTPLWALYARLPLQLVLIAWAWWATRPDAEGLR